MRESDPIERQSKKSMSKEWKKKRRKRGENEEIAPIERKLKKSISIELHKEGKLKNDDRTRTQDLSSDTILVSHTDMVKRRESEGKFYFH